MVIEQQRATIKKKNEFIHAWRKMLESQGARICSVLVRG